MKPKHVLCVTQDVNAWFLHRCKKGATSLGCEGEIERLQKALDPCVLRAELHVAGVAAALLYGALPCAEREGAYWSQAAEIQVCMCLLTESGESLAQPWPDTLRRQHILAPMRSA
eukprot:3900911-Pleurochrysis_carterae.AAC.1